MDKHATEASRIDSICDAFCSSISLGIWFPVLLGSQEPGLHERLIHGRIVVGSSNHRGAVSGAKGGQSKMDQSKAQTKLGWCPIPVHVDGRVRASLFAMMQI